MSIETATRWFSIGLAFSLIIQTLEYWSLSQRSDVKALFDWSVQKDDLRQAPKLVQAVFEFLFTAHIHIFHLMVRVILSLSLLIQPTLIAAVLLWISTLLLLVRWRGAFNGGSDFMTLVCVTGLSIGIGASYFTNEKNAWTIGLFYVAIHSITSYFMSGAVKLLNRSWRNGEALIYFLDGGLYGPLPPHSLFRRQSLAILASWGFILWEISFPLVFFDGDLARIYCLIAFAFHLLVFRFFGLNRFVWAWTATFPAILYCAGIF